MREQDRKKLLTLKEQLKAEKISQQQNIVNGEYETERNRIKKSVWVTGVHNGVVTYKEALDRKDSLTISVEKFTKFYHLVKADFTTPPNVTMQVVDESGALKAHRHESDLVDA